MASSHPRLGAAISKKDPRAVLDEYQQWKDERKKQKELLKVSESIEEKRQRRLAKKESKERKRLTEMGWDEEYMGYTNFDNPFNDQQLLKSFTWVKKQDKIKSEKKIADDDLQKQHQSDIEKHRGELEKVKQRRQEWERQREELDREKEMIQRMKESEFYKEWERQEDLFHLQQAKLRSDIRIKDARAKPIDFLAKYIGAEDDDSAVELHEPYLYLNGLGIEDLDDLLEDIKTYTELEEGKNADYWRDITTVVKEELRKLKKIDPRSKDITGDRRESINKAVATDVNKVFDGKSLAQLQMLEAQVRSKLAAGGDVDVGYWESLLDQLNAHMARQRLRERHEQVLRTKLVKLKQEQGLVEPLFPSAAKPSKPKHQLPTAWMKPPPSLPSTAAAPSTSSSQPPEEEPSTSSMKKASPSQRSKSSSSSSSSSGSASSSSSSSESSSDEEEKKDDKQAMPPPSRPIDPNKPSTSKGSSSASGKKGQEIEKTPEEVEAEAAETRRWASWDPVVAYQRGCYSPKLLDASLLAIDDVVDDPEDDLKKLQYQRDIVANQGKDVKMGREDEFEKKAREGMNDDEVQFSVEVPIEQQRFLWSDKYRPRKPRFFNRVHTGWEWNKYNQTHYDLDNPPPKVVQGYKFSIFYPDLIDKAKSPEYTITPCRDDPEFCILRFKAGAPYEDIAFKVVNREWDTSHRHGFRCQFNSGIFQLWFHFKKFRYRR